MTSKEFPAIPDMQLNMVDVRDVAYAHVKALTTDKPNERYILLER